MIGGIGRSLAGAWNVMNGRAEGLGALDLTLRGFWRSFGAIALVAPLVLLALASERTIALRLAQPVSDLSGSAIFLALAALTVYWFTFPVIFALLAPTLGVSDRYVPFIVARNWAIVVTSAMTGAASVLLFLPLPLDIYIIAMLVLLGAALRFAYLVVRVTLVVPPSVAAPVVLLDLLLWLLVDFGFERLA